MKLLLDFSLSHSLSLSSIKSPGPRHSSWINCLVAKQKYFLASFWTTAVWHSVSWNGFKSMSCLCMAAFGWRNTMNECACNSMSPHNGKDSLLYRLYFDSSREWQYGSRDPGSGYIVDGRRITFSIWLFLASVVWLIIMVDRSTYLWANRAITFTEENPFTLDWHQWIELYVQLHHSYDSFLSWLYQLLSPIVSLEFYWLKTVLIIYTNYTVYWIYLGWQNKQFKGFSLGSWKLEMSIFSHSID